MTPIFEHSDNGHELLVVDFVVTLGYVYHFGSVHNEVLQAIVALLQKYPACGEVGCIDFEFGGLVRVA